MIRFEKICAGYPGQDIFDGLSFRGPDGPLMVITGATGSGKTTLLRLVAGLSRPRSGRILINEEPVDDNTVFVPPHRRGIGMVFQQRALWPHMTVEETLGFVLDGCPRKDLSTRVDDMLSMLDLRSLRGRRPQELSGGEATRVAVARALAPRPRLLLMDEPMTGLDRASRDRVLVAVGEHLRRTDARAVVVTHRRDDLAGLKLEHYHLLDGRLTRSEET